MESIETLASLRGGSHLSIKDILDEYKDKSSYIETMRKSNQKKNKMPISIQVKYVQSAIKYINPKYAQNNWKQICVEIEQDYEMR